MFTGIVEAVGLIQAIERRGQDARVRIAPGSLPLEDVRLGDSIAVSGVCLTVVDCDADALVFDLSGETLARTTWGHRAPGDKVNLEKALALGERLGGHLVSGHVDGVGRVRTRDTGGRSTVLWFDAPTELRRYIAVKGSICVDGVSLTVNAIDAEGFAVTLVPHTLAVTTLGDLKAGDSVNLEVDMIARYLERLLAGEKADAS